MDWSEVDRGIWYCILGVESENESVMDWSEVDRGIWYCILGVESESESVTSVMDWSEVDRGICSWITSIFTITDDMILRYYKSFDYENIIVK